MGKYFKLHVPKASGSRVAVALADGNPLIVERSVHRGRVVLVATSTELDWTLMPKWHSYPAIVQEILAFAVAGQVAQRNVEVGHELGGSVSAPAGDVAETLARAKQQINRLEAFLRHNDKDSARATVPVNTGSFYWRGSEALREEFYGL